MNVRPIIIYASTGTQNMFETSRTILNTFKVATCVSKLPGLYEELGPEEFFLRICDIMSVIPH